MHRDLVGRRRCALLLGLLGFACWAPQAAASSFCQLINSPDGTPRTGSLAPNQNLNINGLNSWANNAGDKVTVDISNPSGPATRGTFTGGGLHISFFGPGVFEGTSSDYYRGGGGTIYINSQEGGFDYTISCESALPVLASVTPGSGGAGTTVTLGGQALYGLADEVAVTIGGVAATITNNTGLSITATVPAGLAVGSHDVTVTTEAGASTLPDAFTVLATDTEPPAVTAIDRVDASPTNADSVRYAVFFSEAVTGVDAADFSVTATGTATGAVASVATTDSILYTVTVNGVGDGTLRLDLNGSGTGIIDAAGNPAAGFTGGEAYTVDRIDPVVTSVSVPADGRYLAGDALDFTVHLSEAVIVDTAGGTPYLELTVGSTSRQASYVSGSGTGALAFRYIVQAGDRDYDGVMLGTTIVANGGTLRDATGNDTAPALNAVGSTSGVLVGTGEQTKAAQAISQFVANPDAPTYAAGGTFTVAATGGDSGNPVVFASTSPGVCTIEGATVTMLSAGACALTADQAGNDDYAAAPQAMIEVAIAAATPTLTWIEDLQKILGEPAFDLPDPDSDSTGAFSFTSSNAEVATVSGSTVTIVGAGTTTLVATQAAAGNYTAATASLTLTVAARPDPTLDPEVVGGLQAQVDASVRFANAQQDNIRDRLRQLRDGRGNPSANHLTFSASAGSGPGLSLGTERLAGAMPALAHGWGLWAAGTISLGERDRRNGSNGFDFRSNGVALGVDRLFGQNLVLGAAGGLGWNDTDFDDSTSQQDARQRSVALYGLWRGDGPLFVDGQLGLGQLDFDLWRWGEAAGATAQAQREGDQLFGSLTVGYEHAGERSRMAGYGRYDASHTTLDAYRESGLGIYDLSYGRQTIDNSTLALGVEGSYQLRATTLSLRPYWSLEYRQALGNRGDARLNYVVQPVTQDYLLGMRSYNDDTLALGAGLDVDLDSGWNLSFLLRHEQSSGIGSASSFGLRVSYGQASGADMATHGGAGYVTPGIDPFRAIDPQTGLRLQP